VIIVLHFKIAVRFDNERTPVLLLVKYFKYHYVSVSVNVSRHVYMYTYTY